MPVMEIKNRWVIKIDDAKLVSLMIDFDDSEGGISHFTHFTDGQCADDRRHHLIKRHIRLQHGDDNFCREGCQYIGLNTAAQTIGKDDDGFVVTPVDFDLIAAQLLTGFIQTQIVNIQEIVHGVLAFLFNNLEQPQQAHFGFGGSFA